MNTPLIFSDVVVTETLAHLRNSGKDYLECVVLWLGTRKDGKIYVNEVYRPEQVAESDFFHISHDSMLKLKEYIRRHRLFVAAQVHSHPGEAFHSAPDDKWAIVRHEGALSIVLPYFAGRTSDGQFFEHAATYRLSRNNTWEQVTTQEAQELCQLVR